MKKLMNGIGIWALKVTAVMAILYAGAYYVSTII